MDDDIYSSMTDEQRKVYDKQEALIILDKDCIICLGKHSVEEVAAICTSEYVCKKHIEKITRYLLKLQKQEEECQGRTFEEAKMQGEFE